MCGIAGYRNISKTECPFDDALLHAMEQSMSHRGPDGFGVWKSERHQTALVHRRLSIVDLSDAGYQPMLDAENTVAVSFNGEIYNHRVIRAELERRGYRYQSQTDTETLLYAYKEWGIDFINRLEGMFAIALFDIAQNELFLIRDRIGVKPLYFSLQGGVLSFASEIKALWQLPWMQKKLNPQALYHYLTHLVSPAPTTMYADVYKLPPSFYLRVDARNNITFHEWYSPITTITQEQKTAFNNEQFCIDGIRRLLSEAVQKRMMADVPLGVFLSGGIDSSLNVALMSQFTDKVKTFTVAFSDGPEYDELQWARKVAHHYNTEHHEIIIEEKDAFEFFQKMIFHQDEPLADCVCIPVFYVAKLLKDTGVTVVQVGEGSDELFCGYSNYAQYIDLYHRYWQPTQKYIPAFARSAMHATARRLFPTKYNHLDLLKNWATNQPLFLGGALAFLDSWKKEYLVHNASSHDPIVQQIYPGLQLNESTNDVVQFYIKKLQKSMPEADFLTTMMYVELKNRLPELLLTRVDKMTMAVGVEARVPFLDHKLVEFAFHVPSRFKYHNGTTKYILKKAAEGILPHGIIYRKKMGFAAPTKRWFKDGRYFKPYLHDLLASKNTVWHDYLNMPKITTLLQAHQQKDADYSVLLWTLQNAMALEL